MSSPPCRIFTRAITAHPRPIEYDFYPAAQAICSFSLHAIGSITFTTEVTSTS